MSARSQAEEARRFAASRGGVDAVIQRIGRDTWDLILIAADGAWDRWVCGSDAEARGAAEAAGASVHEGWTDELSQRLTRRDEWRAPGGTRRAL
jgi:hypothetical protein